MRKRPLVAHPDNPLWMLVPLGGEAGGYAVVDVLDAEEVGRHNWCPSSSHGITYALTGFRNEDGLKTTLLLHRLVGQLAGFDLSLEVDHKNRDGLDCRRSNLRSATHQQNQANQGIRITNTSGVKGVRWHTVANKWEARVRVNGKQYQLGTFADLSEAKAAVEEAREQLHGAFACHG